MTNTGRYRWRKVTDVNREYALFELLEGNTLLLDVGFSDDGLFEITFNPSISGKAFQVKEFLQLLDEGRTFADRDR